MKKYYMILDCETATIPKANENKLGLDFPLIYDLGYIITDTKGNILETENTLIAEVFNNDTLFNTAYYNKKKPLYLEKLAENTIKIGNWSEISAKFEEILKKYRPTVCAYNANFDLKKAINFTELFFKAENEIGNFWKKIIDEKIENKINKVKFTGTYIPNPFFTFRKNNYKIIDIWRVACENLLNTNKYRNYCFENGYLTKTNYPQTSAEIVYRYLFYREDFIEEHTAFSDCEIEMEILFKVFRQHQKINFGIVGFPFRCIGKV
jgi:hypothetical protein